MEVVDTLSGPSLAQLHSLLYTAAVLPKVPFTLSMTRAVPPRFPSCTSGGDGSSYSI